jgi:hypothetical protein
MLSTQCSKTYCKSFFYLAIIITLRSGHLQNLPTLHSYTGMRVACGAAVAFASTRFALGGENITGVLLDLKTFLKWRI